MNNIEEIFELSEIAYSMLPKNEGYKIHRAWLEIFAISIKEQTGKFTLNGYVWEAYWSGILPSVDGDEGIGIYQSKPPEDYFVIYENGAAVYSCKSGIWPDLFSLESIIFPRCKEWAMVYSHENTAHFVEAKT